MIKKTVRYLLPAILIVCVAARPASTSTGKPVINWKKVHVLVYIKNGKGYVHGNIAAASAAMQELGSKKGFSVNVTDRPTDFTDANLQQYQVLVFNNTNNDVFENDDQKLALMHYIQAGGGFVGLHSATGTERNWPWFKRLIGATFQRHARHQVFTEVVIDSTHPSTRSLPHHWEQNDECYFFKEVNPDLHVLMVHSLVSLLDDKDKPDFYGASSPSVWCHQFDGGREWYTSLGHDSSTYFNPAFQQHLLGGIEWAVGDNKPLDYSKVHAKSPGDALPY